MNVVYKISRIHGAEQDCYIGSSVKYKTRWRIHKSSLRGNYHENNKLQNAWNKYGENNFHFSIIEEVHDPSELVLIQREQHHIDTIKPKYNIMKIAGRPPTNPDISRLTALRLHENGTWDDRTPVLQIDINTDTVIKTYSSQAETVKDGFDQKHVSNCCLGKRGKHKGYKWKFADKPSVQFNYKENGKPVIQFDLNTKKEIHTYDKATLAEKDGFSPTAISMCCNGLRGSHEGFGWKFADGSTPEWKYKTTGTPVIAYDPLTGKDIYKYTSMTEAKIDGFNESKISACCSGKRKTHKGLSWRKFDQSPIIYNKIKQTKPIECVDPISHLTVKEYENTNKAKQDGFSVSLIRACLYGQRLSHKGYLWRYKEENLIKTVNKSITTSPVCCMSNDNNVVKIYDYVAQVKEDGFSPSKVRECCLGKRKTHGGLRWKHV